MSQNSFKRSFWARWAHINKPSNIFCLFNIVMVHICCKTTQPGGVASSCDPSGGEAGEVVVSTLRPVRHVDGKSSSILASTAAALRRRGRHGG